MTTNNPLIVAYGGGRDSTAMLIHQVRIGWRPDVILFANHGGEKRETYAFLPIFDRWLRDHDFPGITTVAYEPERAPYTTLEGNMVMNATLPGAAYNKHSCTVKFKIEPQNKWTARWRPAQEAWARGAKVTKLIGFECDELHRLKRADAKAHAGKANKDDAARYEYRMPLMEWGFNLERCIEIITDAGLPVPPKSACYFCPFQQTEEVDAATPEDRARTILIELAAEPHNTAKYGLWGRPRKEDGRPGSITEYILQKKLDFVPLDQIAPAVVMNKNCGKPGSDAAFVPHHGGPSLRSQLAAAGHYVPQVLRHDQWDGISPVYQESKRQVPAWIENEVHAELVAAL